VGRGVRRSRAAAVVRVAAMIQATMEIWSVGWGFERRDWTVVKARMRQMPPRVRKARMAGSRLR
jgi:hypothetical protein